MLTTYDTLPNGRPARGVPTGPESDDRTAQLARMIRHSLKAGAASTPLDRAIRSAVGSEDDGRVAALAERLNDLLGQRLAVQPHLETVCG
jgi:hypothetical protein